METFAYDAYEEAVIPVLRDVAAEMRKKWAAVRRVALIHRVGDVPVGESSVLVVVSAPHRPEAFEAARFGIDAHVTDLSSFVAERASR